MLKCCIALQPACIQVKVSAGSGRCQISMFSYVDMTQVYILVSCCYTVVHLTKTHADLSCEQRMKTVSHSCAPVDTQSVAVTSCCHHVLTEVSACAFSLFNLEEWVGAVLLVSMVIQHTNILLAASLQSVQERSAFKIKGRQDSAQRNYQFWHQLNDLLDQHRKKGSVYQPIILHFQLQLFVYHPYVVYWLLCFYQPFFSFFLFGCTSFVTVFVQSEGAMKSSLSLQGLLWSKRLLLRRRQTRMKRGKKKVFWDNFVSLFYLQTNHGGHFVQSCGRVKV